VKTLASYEVHVVGKLNRYIELRVWAIVLI